MRTDEDEYRWQTLLQREAISRIAVLREGAGPNQRQRLQGWWKTVYELLTEYSKEVARLRYPEPPPISAIDALRGLAGELSVGQLPMLIKGAVSEGRRRATPSERRDIGLAVAYYHACQSPGLEHNGELILIDDPKPIERIHQWYGVAKRTVYDWIKHQPIAFLGVNNVNVQILQLLTVKAAERYRAKGRSQAAVRTRASKRSRAGN